MPPVAPQGTDARAVLRVVDELLWSLRRAGFRISTAQAIDAVRAVAAVGIEGRDVVREAVASVAVQHARERRRFDAAFDAFFAVDAEASRGTIWERLAARGFDASEIDHVRASIEALAAARVHGVASLGALLDRGAELDRLLALSGVHREIDAHAGLQLGFRAHRLLGQMGAERARGALTALRAMLVEALGARGEAIADALAQELERAAEDVRAYVRRVHADRVADAESARTERRLETTPFASLSDAELEEVRRAVRRFAERLRGGARVRSRRALRGRIDPHRTIRLALRTGGVPFAPARRSRRRDRPKLVLLCDVSDSVRAVACFLLEFVYAVQELFARAKSFVFVSDLGETTELFRAEPVRIAIARAWGGGVVGTGDNSNYGRVLRSFEARHLRDLDRRTTVVILGDGRTNYHDASADALDRIRASCRQLLWLCPEPRGLWSQGDSAMATYAEKCTAVYEVGCAADLEAAARVLVARG